MRGADSGARGAGRRSETGLAGAGEGEGHVGCVSAAPAPLAVLDLQHNTRDYCSLSRQYSV